jgi:hypothetical protein
MKTEKKLKEHDVMPSERDELSPGPETLANISSFGQSPEVFRKFRFNQMPRVQVELKNFAKNG